MTLKAELTRRITEKHGSDAQITILRGIPRVSRGIIADVVYAPVDISLVIIQEIIAPLASITGVEVFFYRGSPLTYLSLDEFSLLRR